MQRLLYSHLFLALCASLLSFALGKVWVVPTDKSYWYCSFVFFSTVIVYNTKGIIAIYKNKDNLYTDKLSFAVSHPVFISTLVGSAVVGAFVSFVFLWSSFLIIVIVPLALLSILYSVTIRVKQHTISIRQLPYTKAIFVALVWAVLVAFLPSRQGNGIESDSLLFPWLCSEFLLLYALALLFDLKDEQVDQRENVKTFPQLIGFSSTKLLSLGLLVGRLVLIVSMRPYFFLELLISVLASVVILFFLTKRRTEYFYMLVLDGIMLMKALVILVFI